METKNLPQHIRTLVTLTETEAPVISCYLNLESNGTGYRGALDERVRLLRKSLTGTARRDFEEAVGRIEAFLATELLPGAKGAAIFARGGAAPFFLPLQFRVPFRNWIAIDPTPNIYHLVELKDTYHRYVLLICTEQWARILEVTLGAVTEQLWMERPQLRARVGCEWTKEHYQSHRREQTHKFVKEMIDTLKRVMVSGGHTHLILASNRQLAALVRRELPKSLADKLVDIVPGAGGQTVSEIVAATLAAFVEQEQRESLALVYKLQQDIRSNGLAVVGTTATLLALRRGQADALILAEDYHPAPGWSCAACGMLGTDSVPPRACPECGAQGIRPHDLKEEMARIAAQQGCHIETVRDSAVLVVLGGVGCLLRYRPAERYGGDDDNQGAP